MNKDEIEIIQEQERVKATKLIRKVAIIVCSMIIILTGIIIIEFKEYSNNYNEYKIGKADLGPRDLVWAGIMGTPSRYFESDTKYGLGYKEFATREIRKALESEGINLIYRYMSPNRLEFEFERKHPICFYDRTWNDPKEYFKKPRHPVLSIPLYYSGNRNRKIFFRKGERGRFEKHLDSKGNIVLDSLIKDEKLKTELIRKVEYDGPYANITYGKRQLDKTYYDYILPKFQKHIDLVILHTNDQIIQMLDWKRFDYQFLDTLENDDFFWAKGGSKGIETLSYAETFIQNYDDPNLIFHSVACGNHPLVKSIMPTINSVIKTIRDSPENYERIRVYENKLNAMKKRKVFGFSMFASPTGYLVEKLDEWYIKQFEVKKISPWPMFKEKSQLSIEKMQSNLKTLQKIRAKFSQPKWFLIERKNNLGEKTIMVINESEKKSKQDEILIKDNFLDNQFMSFQETYIDEKENFTDLQFSLLNSIQKIVIFARGIKNEEFKLLSPFFQRKELKSVTLIESSIYQSKMMLSWLDSQTENLEQLRLYDVPLFGMAVGQTLKKLKNLRSLNIHANSIINGGFQSVENQEFISIIKNISEKIVDLSFVGRETESEYTTDLPLEVAEIFSKRKFRELKSFRLHNYMLPDVHVQLILESLPLQLESLIIGSTGNAGGISSLLLESFLHKRKNVNSLKRLRLTRMLFSLHKDNILFLPSSLEDFSLINTKNLEDVSFDRIKIHPEMKLKNLTLTGHNLNDNSVLKFMNQLEEKIETLNISENKLTGKIFQSLKKGRFSGSSVEIQNLNLRSNPIDDYGFWFLSQLPWKIKNLDISNMKITKRSAMYLLQWNLMGLQSLNLSDNYLNAQELNQIFEKYVKNLTALMVDNVISLDVKKLSTLLTKKMEYLSIAGNMLDDKELALLASNLPRDLSYLDISGSYLNGNMAYFLSFKMPKLTSFKFDFLYGETTIGLNYILQNLSPYLIKIPPFRQSFTFDNVLFLSKNMPRYLYELNIRVFEKEECKSILSNLPDSLRKLVLFDSVSKGSTLKILAENYPSHLNEIFLDTSIGGVERDKLVDFLDHQFVSIQSFVELSYKYVKYESVYRIRAIGSIKPENYKGITFPVYAIFLGKGKSEIPLGFLDSLKEPQLLNVKYLALENSELDAKELSRFLKKLSPYVLVLYLENLKLSLKDVDMIIEALPKNLRFLSVRRNIFGEEGAKKFKAFKQWMEDKTGLPFTLLVEQNY